MAKILKLPEIAESVVEGEIVRWLKAEGEPIRKNEPLVEVMTEKVTVEIPSPYEGTLARILAPEGTVVPVHEAIALIAEPGEDPARVAAEAPVGARPETAPQEPASAPTPAAPSPPEVPAAPSGRVRATPAARKLARELGIDLSQVTPAKPSGRIEKRDVQRFAEALQARKPVAPTPTTGARRVPFRGLRREIAKRLRTSQDRAVHTLHVDEADLTRLVALRERLLPVAEAEGVKLSYLPFILKAVIAALRKHPEFNATVDDDAQEILLHDAYHIGIAVATDQGLVVPVIHHAEEKGLLDLAREIADKAQRAREGRLTLEDVEGGTFSITNIGSIGGLFSFPVINYPQVAILGVHRIQPRPVVRNGEIQVRQMTYLSLSFDHRVTDGAQAAYFMNDLIRYLETPELLML